MLRRLCRCENPWGPAEHDTRRIAIRQAAKEANGFTRDPSGANLPADRGAFSAFKAIEIFEDHPSPRLGVVELAEECSRKRNY